MENKNYNNSKNEEIIMFLLLFLPCLFIKRVIDNDTWFLLNSGRYVMNYGIPHIEPFSIHENLEFVMQQWLTDVTFWTIYKNFGENGLFIIVMISYAIITLLMFKLTMKVSSQNFFISFLITIMSSIMIFVYMVTRPTIFTLIIVMIELNVLENYARGNYKYIIVLPILSLILINLHAALWPVLFVFILPYILESFNVKIGIIKWEGYVKRYLFITVLAMFLIAFLNPYGIKAITYLLYSTGHNDYMNFINEIQPPYVNDLTGAIVYVYIAIIVLVYIFNKKGKTKVRYILLTIGTIYMVLSSVRNITYFAIGSLFPLAYYLKGFSVSQIINSKNKKNNRLRAALISIILVVSFYGIHMKNTNNNTMKEYFDLNNTIDYILNNEDSSDFVIYTGFNDGALVQFRNLPSYIDPRAEVYFKKQNGKDDIFDEYFDLQLGNVYYKKILDKYKFTHLIVGKGDILNTYLPMDDDYKLIYTNESYNLFKSVKSNEFY